MYVYMCIHTHIHVYTVYLFNHLKVNMKFTYSEPESILFAPSMVIYIYNISVYVWSTCCRQWQLIQLNRFQNIYLAYKSPIC